MQVSENKLVRRFRVVRTGEVGECYYSGVTSGLGSSPGYAWALLDMPNGDTKQFMLSELSSCIE